MPDGSQAVLHVIQGLLADWADGQPDEWENWTIPQYLEAMSAWLDVYERAYTNTGRDVPTDGWVVFADALRAAAFYE